ncbi:hypothetical protein AVEN_187952-1 [Araneus ventricosus]|uniref:Uncharacterized protein n=1 Tax=Araneus ventricosus TaxID=182803 RepID=A0A4Y2E256_ARAVE|nr:hypothetical protein AVEN_187952-1 [Araneus ventricosus]
MTDDITPQGLTFRWIRVSKPQGTQRSFLLSSLPFPTPFSDPFHPSAASEEALHEKLLVSVFRNEQEPSEVLTPVPKPKKSSKRETLPFGGDYLSIIIPTKYKH